MKYYVTVYEVHSRCVPVEADNPDHAREIVNDMLEDGSPTYTELEYSYTINPEEWKVEDK